MYMTTIKEKTIKLSVQEEREREQVARQENLYLMRQCIVDARHLLKDEKMLDIESHVLNVAMALFRKRASHAVHYKAELCQRKYDKLYGEKEVKAKKVKK